MARLNWKIIGYNIADAREQLEELERYIKESPRRSEIDLQVKLEHAFHHLSVAWNARNASISRYSNISEDDFNLWSKFPKDLEEYRLGAESENETVY